MELRIFASIGASGLLFSFLLSAINPFFFSSAVLAQSPPISVKNKDANQSDKLQIIKTSADKLSPARNIADAKRPLAVNEDPAMIGKRNINKGFDRWVGGSQAKEVAIGRQYAAQIEKELKMLDDPLVTEYVNRVGQNIVNHSDAKVPFTIKVVDSDEVNAFALPGGFFYVNKGLVLAADNESELAGVMAHETGHVCARHVVEQQGKQQMISYGMLGAILATGGIAGAVLQNTAGLAQGLLGLKFSRGVEEEADRLGLQYMYAAGYDPNGMSTMFEKLSEMNKKKPKGFMKLLMTHPESLERRDTALALAARFPEKEEYVISTSEFQRVKAHLLKTTNAKASTNGDIDDSSETGRPTMKRRAPAPDDSTGTPAPTPSSEDKKDEQKERPQLKRRTEEPKPQSSPAPSPNR